MPILDAATQSPALKPYRWSIDCYHRAVAAGVFDGQPVELLAGELIEMSPEGIPHAGLSSDAADYLRERLGSRVKVREAKPITLPDDSEPEPDIAIVRPLGGVYKTERHPYVEDIFWLIEYANTSLEKDRDVKSAIYAQAGIGEYWLVNLRARELVVYRDPADGQYQSEVTLTSGVIYPISFPSVAVDVARLIQ